LKLFFVFVRLVPIGGIKHN